jgi:hypothetical protein
MKQLLSLLGTGLLVAAGAWALPRDEPSYERAPIRYSESRPVDPVAGLQERLDAGRQTLRFDASHGYLRSFLAALEVPVSSQVLVFSKTSFQKSRISPTTPRAIYFNDEVYVGWCLNGDVVEISSVDPQLGSVFYVLPQAAVPKPKVSRQTHHCLQCHDSTGQTLGVPGHIVRSVFAGDDGMPHFNRGTFKIDHRSPYAERWGGWYVTGEAGTMRHLGNTLFGEEQEDLKALAEKGANRADLPPGVDAKVYLSPGSDIVALLVLEHQTYTHNLITRANHETRLALLQSEEINRLAGTPGAGLTEGARSRIRANGEPLLAALLYSGEPPLPSPVKGTSSFAEDFARHGPWDPKGRTLREFDLKRRLFRHPFSYLVYSKAFAGLPDAMKDYLATRLDAILSGRGESKDYAHLSAADRRAIREIVAATVPDLAKRWK